MFPNRLLHAVKPFLFIQNKIVPIFLIGVGLILSLSASSEGGLLRSPTVIRSTLNNSRGTLYWVPAAGSAGVLIRQSTSTYPINSTAGSHVASSLSGSSYLLPTYSDGLYYFTIFSVDANSYASGSTKALLVVDTITPNLTATPSSANSSTITLTWPALSSWPSSTLDYQKYILTRQRDSGPAVTINSNIASNVTSTTNSNLSDGTYVYRLYVKTFTSTIGYCYYGRSNAITIDTTAPAAPTLTASKPSLNGSSIDLSWNVPTDTVRFVLQQNDTIISSNISAS